jgi:tetratricopeptide (TPR) repeat protein
MELMNLLLILSIISLPGAFTFALLKGRFNNKINAISKISVKGNRKNITNLISSIIGEPVPPSMTPNQFIKNKKVNLQHKERIMMILSGSLIICFTITTISYVVLRIFVANNRNSNIPEIIPTPIAFSPSSNDEELIIINDFEDRSKGKLDGIDPAQHIYQRIFDIKNQSRLNIRVERIHEGVTANPAIVRAYKPTILISGWYDALIVNVRIDNFSGFGPSSKSASASISNANTFEFTITRRIPSHIQYTALVTIAVKYMFRDLEIDKALNFADQAIKSVDTNDNIDIDMSLAYGIRGSAYSFNENEEAALADFDKALSINPQLDSVYLDRAQTRDKLGDTEGAISDYEQYLKMKGDGHIFSQMAKDRIAELKKK